MGTPASMVRRWGLERWVSLALRNETENNKDTTRGGNKFYVKDHGVSASECPTDSS